MPKGSHGRIDRSIFMRTAQLNTAAFPKMDNHIDFFKVPKRLLMSRYEEFLTNTNDAHSSAILDANGSTDIPTTAPYVKRSDVRTLLQSTTYKDLIGDYTALGAYRLLDLLGYDAVNCIAQTPGSTPAATDAFECNLNAFRLLAYQKIYYDHFRNTNYEANYVFAYNADYWYTQSSPGYIASSNLHKVLELHYVNTRKDYMTNLYPALNYSLNNQGSSGWSLPSSVVGASLLTVNSNYNPVLDNINYNLQSSPSVVSGDRLNTISSVSVQQIRAIFALDKLMRASAYAPKHVRDQIEARFGVKCRMTYSHESEYLGSFMNDIVIGEVTSTANTLTSSGGDGLGAIGGKGVSGDKGGHVIEFDTNEDDCIIMGVMYSLCRSMYDSTRIDPFNTKFSKEDYFQPEFMNLGLRPLYQYELYTVQGINAQSYSNQIRGYVPRYQEYKVSVDENHLLFNENRQLGIFTPHFNKSLLLTLASGNGVGAQFFKMCPYHLDSIFVSNYDPTELESDQFYGEIQFKFDVRQNMSVHGQPSL